MITKENLIKALRVSHAKNDASVVLFIEGAGEFNIKGLDIVDGKLHIIPDQQTADIEDRPTTVVDERSGKPVHREAIERLKNGKRIGLFVKREDGSLIEYR